MTRIALFEFIDEFEAFKIFVGRKGLRLDDFLIVALEPKLSAYLKTANVPHKNTLPYFNSDSHRTILVETEKVMEYIRTGFNFIDNNGLRGCYRKELAQYVRLFLNHILRRLEIIFNICKEHSNAELYAYVYNDGASTHPLITTDERYCGLLVKRFAEGQGIAFFNINENGSKPAQMQKERRPFNLLEQLFFKGLTRFLKGRKVIMIPRAEGHFRKLTLSIADRDKDVVFLIIDSQKNLAKSTLFNALSIIKRKPPFYFVINAAFFHPVIGAAERGALFQAADAFTDEDKRSLFSFRGVEYRDMVRQKVDIAVKPHLEKILLFSHALRYIFERCKNNLVISDVGLDIMAVAGELARVMKRRSLFISHGTHPVPIDRYHELELNSACRAFMLGDYTHVALCTPIQEAHLHYFKDKYTDIDNKEVKTGPLIFASIKTANKEAGKRNLGISSDCTVITHAVSIKARYSERFYFLETLDEFFSSLGDVVNAVNALDNVRLIVRIHPGFHWSDEEIRSLLPASDRYIIHRTGSFSRLLEATDVLISYSSTTIDEALIARIPVLLYDKWDRYNHFKTGVFEGANSKDVFPLCYVNSRDKLQPALKFIIGKAQSVDRKDFDVRRYCYDDDYSEVFHSFVQQSLQA